MRERHLCTIFKLQTNSFCRQRMGLEVLIKVTVEPIFLSLSLTSELDSDLGCGPIVKSPWSSSMTSTHLRMS